jgi:hypothetical protein
VNPLGFVMAAAVAGATPGDATLRALVSRSDLHYDAPAPRSEEGLPLGNGRMGTLVWTSPQALRFQINRADIYPMSSRSTSFFERHGDYCGGAAFVDVDLGDDVFTGPAFAQHLAVYDGAMEVRGAGVTARLLAWHEQDVIALEVDDRRTRPQPIHVNLRMLRVAQPYVGDEMEQMVKDRVVTVRTLQHTAASRLQAAGETIALTQEFKEADHFNASAVTARVLGRAARPRFPHESEVRLAIPAARGKIVILLASAASFDPKEDVFAAASRALDAAAARGAAALARDNRDWWHAFWEKGHVDLGSADGSAEYVEENYHYFLYLMASSSRGKFPTKFNGMLWNTGGDVRAWGSQHWFANLSCYYEALPATNRLELMDPMFEMYGGAREAYAAAARQQWGSQGLFVPETTFFDGLAPLPDEIAAEMRDLYLLRKPWSERSERFLAYAGARHPHSSRWNWYGGGRWVDGRWVPEERGSGPYGPVTHILGTTAKVPYLFWRRYEFTQDKTWLRERAYPMLKGAAEFYYHFPNVKKGDDGRFHIHHVNSNESVWGARDTDEDLAAMRGIFGAAIRASEILGEDAEQRGAWRERLAHLPPLPTSADPEAIGPTGYKGPPIFVRGLRPVVQGGGTPDGNSLPAFFFDLCNLESDDRGTLGVANATFDYGLRRGLTRDTPVGVLSKQAIAAATLGRADAVRFMIPNQMRVLRAERGGAYKQGGLLANRLTLREGHHALDAQRLGRAAEALHMALLQSNPGRPGGDPVLRLFPAWPKEWDASFKLLARGAFVVSAASRAGRVERVELTSLAGARCRLRNPWTGVVTLRRDGARAETLDGALLEFDTRTGERIALSPAGRP